MKVQWQVTAARDIVNDRIKDFEERVLAKFANATSTRSEAFKDPDFQYVIVQAQYAYARSGDQQVRDTLVDLIARRSLQTERTRLSLSLDEAVERAARLTKNEFAELSLVYFMRYTRVNVQNFEQLMQVLSKFVAPLLPDISASQSSYQYLQAQSLANIEQFPVQIARQFSATYSGLLSMGFSRIELKAHLPDGKKDSLDALLSSCLNDSTKLQFSVMNRNDFHERAANTDLNRSQLQFYIQSARK